jgi:hypothetical protein
MSVYSRIGDRHMRKITLITILLTASVLRSANCASPARVNASDVESVPSDIKCSLQVDLSAQHPAKVMVLNLSDHVVYLYSVFLPKDGLSLVDLFIVRYGGNRVPYRGAMAKLPGKPGKGDFIALSPHNEVSATIPLAGNYDISTPGRYTVQYSAGHPQPGGGTLLVSSNQVSFEQPSNVFAK